MARRPLSRRTTITAALVAALTLPAAAAADAHGRAPAPTRLALPDGFQPEGIATKGSTAYVSSRADGDIYRLDLRTGRGRVVSQGPGTPSLGLKVDGGRLVVAGGTGGDLRVVDRHTGRVERSYTLQTGTAFINDVVLTPRTAYVTDSANAQLFALPLGREGELPTQAQVRRIPLSGQWQQVEGTNANGITTTPDGHALLVVNSTTGGLFRVDPATGAARRVDTGGYALTDGDGMLREGRTLYVVRNRDDLVARLRLSPSGSRARLERTLTSPLLDVPSTVARYGASLYLPNARFTTPATPSTAYDVTSLPAR